MNDPLYNRLRELSWRRKLTDAEEAQLRAFLAAHPEALVEWEAEAGLDQLLEQLPNLPVASNFTARVLQAVELEMAGRSRQQVAASRKSWWPSLSWLTKAAVAAVVLGLGLLGYRHHRVIARAQMAESLPNVSSVISLHNPEIWENFDDINQLRRTPTQPDRELLALLK